MHLKLTICMLDSWNKANIDYKGNAWASKICFLALNCSRVSEFVISGGTMFHIFGQRYLRTHQPQLTVFTDPKWRSVFELRLYWVFLCSTFSCIIGVARFSFVLYSSVVNILRFLTWVVTELFFPRSFSNVNIFSL